MQELDSKTIKRNLVENSFRFLTQSIKEFETSIQFSVIHFFSSIELFLKARLLDEHWTLIYEKPDDATIAGLLNGDFKSVTLNTAIKRLKNVARVILTDQEIKCFETIRLHRNKAVHFFHDLQKPELEALREEVASLQCQGWHYLQELIAKKWDASFAEFQGQISECNKLMNSQRKYLKNKFERKRSEIERLRASGAEISECYFCGFLSGRISAVFGPLVKMTCLVCENTSTFIRLNCPRCASPIYSYELGEGSCGKCNYQIEINELMEILDESIISISDIEFQDKYALCSRCEYGKTPTVISVSSKHLCVNCHDVEGAIFFCDVCGKMASGEDNYLDVSLCPHCTY